MRSPIRRGLVAALAWAAAASTFAQAMPTGFQTYQIVGDDDHVWQMLSEVSAAEGGAPFTDGMESIVSITASTDGQVLRYDQWEDGFESDLLAPAQATTLVLGDGDPSNGDARAWTTDGRLTGDEILRGTHVALASRSISGPALEQYVPIPRLVTDVRFDGGDRLVASGGPVSVVHAQQPLGVPFVSGATEMFSREALAEAFSYSVPVGTDTFTRYGGDDSAGEPFKHVQVDIVAFDDGTSVLVDNGNEVTAAFTLNRGEHWSSLGAIGSGPGPAVPMLEGTSIRTSAPVGAMLFTAGPGRYATRMYALLPDRMHDTDFIASAPGDDPGVLGSRPMELYIFNPAAADIVVTATDALGSGSFTVPARGTRAYSEAACMGRALPSGSTARLTSSSRFWVVNAADATGTAVDWGDALIGVRFLSSYYPIGWAPGTSEPAVAFATRAARGCDGQSPCDSLDRAPVYIAAVQDDTLVTVDFDGDGAADVIDLNSDDVPDPAPLPGNTYRIDALEVLRVHDPTDYDNAGTQIRSSKPVSATYAQDPDQGTGSDDTLDLGYAILPYDQRFLDPVLLLEKSGDRSSLPSAGGAITFTLTLSAGNFEPVTGLSLSDLLPEGMTYVAGTSRVTLPGGSTITTEPAIDGRELRWPLPAATLLANERITATYTASLPASAAAVSYTNTASAEGFLGGSRFTPTASFTFVKTDVTLEKSVDRASAGVGDVLTYAITATNHGTSRERGVVVSDPIPPGTTYVPGSASAGGTHDPAQDAVEWIIGSLAAGESATLTFSVIVGPSVVSGEIIRNSAALGSDDVVGLRSLDAVTSVIAPELVGSKTGPAAIAPGDRATYALSARNVGSAPAGAVTLRDAIPAGTTYVPGSLEMRLDGAALTALTDASGDDEGEFSAGEIVVTLGQLAPGSRLDVLFAVDVSASLAPSDFIANQATFGAAEIPASPTNLVLTSIDACAGLPALPADGIGPSLRALGREALTWAVVPGAARYVVHRGTIPHERGMAARQQPYDHECLGRVASPGYFDEALPEGGDAFFYLVGAESDCAAAVTGLGASSLGAARPIPSCP